MKNIIEVKNVTYTYEEESSPVLSDLSLEIEKGEFVLIVGPSGSGKSTLCQLFNGIIPNVLGGDLSGEIIVDDKNVLELDVKDMAESMGLVLQDPDAQLCNIYVEDEIAFAPENLKVDPDEIRRRIDETLERVGLPDHKQRKVYELSGGQKQKVGVASVLSMDPSILVLDNATANLDPQATKSIFELLEILNKEYNHTVIVVESKVDDIMHLADRVVVLEEGKIISNKPPRETLTQSLDKLIDMGIWVPEISELAGQMQRNGCNFRNLPITVEEMRDELANQNFNISTINKPENIDSSSENAFEVNELAFSYPNGTKALKNVSFSIKKGDFIAILGTNGSGKTTLVKHLMGILKPPQGKVFLNGQDIFDKNLHQMTDFISYVFQNPEHQFVADNVLDETIYSLLIKKGINAKSELPDDIKNIGLEALKTIGLEDSLEKNPFTLSGGEKRRLSVIASMILGQDIIILDEPTTGQDYASATNLLKLCKQLNEQGKTVIMITHDIRLVCKWINKALVMSNGELIYNGSINRLFLKEDILKRASLEEPPVSKLTKQLADKPLDYGVITIEDFLKNSNKLDERMVNLS